MFPSSADERSLLLCAEMVLNDLRQKHSEVTFPNVIRHVLEFIRCMSTVAISDVISKG